MTPAHTASILGRIDVQPVTLSDDDRDRVVEIHELVNLLAAELTRLSQDAAGDYGFPPLGAPPAVPYAYSFYQVPQGIGAVAGMRGF